MSSFTGGREPSEEEVTKLKERLDSDKDGLVSKEEFQNGLLGWLGTIDQEEFGGGEAKHRLQSPATVRTSLVYARIYHIESWQVTAIDDTSKCS